MVEIAHIKIGNAIFGDESSTTQQVCDYFFAVTPITVITRLLPVINRIKECGTSISLPSVASTSPVGGFFGPAMEDTIR